MYCCSECIEEWNLDAKVFSCMGRCELCLHLHEKENHTHTKWVPELLRPVREDNPAKFVEEQLIGKLF